MKRLTVVGAGPGSEELLTGRALECIRSATRLYCTDRLYDRLGQQTRRVVDVIAYLLCDALFLCFAVCIWRAFGESWAIKEIQLSAMKMPVYVLKFTIALGITAMLLQLILDTVDAVKLALGQGGNNGLMEEEKL